jgi:Sap, sulfolipid-1-addressing protein
MLASPVGRDQCSCRRLGWHYCQALSPTALLIAAVYLGSARPGLTSLFHLAGAVLTSAVMGVVVFFVLRRAGLNHPDQHAARHGLRLGLGILLFAAGIFAAARKPGRAIPRRRSMVWCPG